MVSIVMGVPSNHPFIEDGLSIINYKPFILGTPMIMETPLNGSRTAVFTEAPLHWSAMKPWAMDLKELPLEPK